MMLLEFRGVHCRVGAKSNNQPQTPPHELRRSPPAILFSLAWRLPHRRVQLLTATNQSTHSSEVQHSDLISLCSYDLLPLPSNLFISMGKAIIGAYNQHGSKC